MSINRRQFVAAASAAAFSAHRLAFAGELPSVKIDRIELFPLRYPMTGYFKFFTGPHGSSGRAAVIIKITADDGTVGWGQSIPVANGGYDTDKALRAAPQLADAGVDVLEAPLRPNQISGYQELKRQVALPILMDEGVITPTELDEFRKLNMIDGVAMKPARCGGLRSNKRQIELCLEHGLMWLGSGLADPDISLAATLSLYAAYGLAKPAALNGPQFITAHVLAQPLRIERDQAHAPSGPGLGIEVDELAVQDLMKRSGGDKLLR